MNRHRRYTGPWSWGMLTRGTLLLLVGAFTLPGCQAFRYFSQPRERVRPVQVTEATDEQAERLVEAAEAMEAGELDTAMELYQAILAENPTITTAYIGIGEIHMINEDFAAAEPAFARASRLEPRNFDAQYGHGRALQMLRRFDEAVRAYHRALTIEPDSADANLDLATTYLETGDPNRALQYAEKAVEVDPENGPARANLGAIYEKLERNTEAIDTYLVALELMGNHPPLMTNLINVLARESRFREAANTAQTLVRLDPTANAYERLGWCMFKLRRYEESRDAYRNAVDIDPDHWPSWNGIGVNALNKWLLSKKRDEAARQEAQDAFRQSLRLNQRQPKVAELLYNYFK